ncbi:MAG: hypothetical protein Kow0090_07420 [Myxococcota bacterium]
MGTAKEMLKFDVRLIQRNLKDGGLTKSELADYIKSLPDLTDKALKVEVDAPRRLGARDDDISAKESARQRRMNEEEEES